MDPSLAQLRSQRFSPTHHRFLKVRMKTSPSETAGEELVYSPAASGLTASTSYFAGSAARTTVVALRMST